MDMVSTQYENIYRVVVINDKKKVSKFLKDNSDTILGMINHCFNESFKNVKSLKDLHNGVLFIAYCEDKIIGIASTTHFVVYRSENKNIKIYDSLAYSYSDFLDDEQILEICDVNCKITNTDKSTNTNTYKSVNENTCITFQSGIDLGHGMYSVCKVSGYENVLRVLLEKICDYYKARNEKYIYVCPESSRWLQKLKTVHNDIGDKCNDLELNSILKSTESATDEYTTKTSITKISNEYINSQKKLISHYERNGFEMLSDHYDCVVMPMSEYQLLPYIMVLPIMRKLL